MKTKTFSTLLALLLGTALAPPGYGQNTSPAASQQTEASPGTVLIPVGSQGGNQPAVNLPAKGLKQAEVLTRFGEPNQRSAPKGNPPISRWQYPGFVVYFEGDTVIHSVLIFQPHNPPPSE